MLREVVGLHSRCERCHVTAYDLLTYLLTCIDHYTLGQFQKGLRTILFLLAYGA